MAITPRTPSTWTSVASGNLTITTPTAAVTGDVLVLDLYIEGASTAHAVTPPDGTWTATDTAVTPSSGYFTHRRYAHVVGSGDGPTSVFTIATGAYSEGVCTAFGGCDTSSGLTSALAQHGLTEGYAVPSLTTTVDGCYLVVGMCDWDGFAWVSANGYTVPTGATDPAGDGAQGYAAQATHGACGGQTWTSGTQASRNTRALLALVPGAPSITRDTGANAYLVATDVTHTTAATATLTSAGARLDITHDVPARVALLAARTLRLANYQATLTGMTTAHQLYDGSSGTQTTYTVTCNLLPSGSGYVELQGGTGASVGTSYPTTPSGLGYLLDDTSLDGLTIPAGDWTVAVPMSESSNTGNINGDVALQVWRRNYNGGGTVTWTLLAQGTGTDTGELTTSYVAHDVTATQATAATFLPGDKLYAEVYWYCNTTLQAHSTSSSYSLRWYNSSTASGLAAATLVTPGRYTLTTTAQRDAGAQATLAATPTGAQRDTGAQAALLAVGRRDAAAQAVLRALGLERAAAAQATISGAHQRDVPTLVALARVGVTRTSAATGTLAVQRLRQTGAQSTLAALAVTRTAGATSTLAQVGTFTRTAPAGGVLRALGVARLAPAQASVAVRLTRTAAAQADVAVRLTRSTGAQVTIGDAWQLIFEDHFDGSNGMPPDNAKWVVEDELTPPSESPQGGRYGDYKLYDDGSVAAYARNMVFQDGAGNLLIRAQHTAYAGKNFRQGSLYTRHRLELLYGAVEIRGKGAPGPTENYGGHWTSFWFIDHDVTYANWEYDWEFYANAIDLPSGPKTDHMVWHQVAKYLGGDPWNHTMQDGFAGNGSAIDYHIYRIEWTPTSFKEILDGTLLRQETPTSYNGGSGVPNVKFFLIMDYELGGSANGIGEAGTSTLTGDMTVDYVRIYANQYTQLTAARTCGASATLQTSGAGTRVRQAPATALIQAQDVRRDVPARAAVQATGQRDALARAVLLVSSTRTTAGAQALLVTPNLRRDSGASVVLRGVGARGSAAAAVLLAVGTRTVGATVTLTQVGTHTRDVGAQTALKAVDRRRDTGAAVPLARAGLARTAAAAVGLGVMVEEETGAEVALGAVPQRQTGAAAGLASVGLRRAAGAQATVGAASTRTTGARVTLTLASLLHVPHHGTTRRRGLSGTTTREGG
jgi:beta-glucanase (GH16 family)